MQELKIGPNTGHIIKRAVNCKTLGTLGREEDAAQVLMENPIKPYVDTRTLGQKFLFYSKENLASVKKATEGKKPEEILELIGIKTSTLPDGSKSISAFHAPTQWCTFKTLGINEEQLLADVKVIKGSCDLTGSYLKNLSGVERIDGTLIIPIFSKLEDLSSLKQVNFISCDAADSKTVQDTLSKLSLNCITFGINRVFNPGFKKLPFQDTLKSFMASGLYKS